MCQWVFVYGFTSLRYLIQTHLTHTNREREWDIENETRTHSTHNHKFHVMWNNIGTCRRQWQVKKSEWVGEKCTRHGRFVRKFYLRISIFITFTLVVQELKYLQLLSVSWTMGFELSFCLQVNHKISFPKAFRLGPVSVHNAISFHLIYECMNERVCVCSTIDRLLVRTKEKSMAPKKNLEAFICWTIDTIFCCLIKIKFVFGGRRFCSGVDINGSNWNRR